MPQLVLPLQRRQLLQALLVLQGHPLINRLLVQVGLADDAAPPAEVAD